MKSQQSQREEVQNCESSIASSSLQLLAIPTFLRKRDVGGRRCVVKLHTQLTRRGRVGEEMNIFPKLKVALCQISVGADKTVNIARASAALLQAAQTGSNLVVLPECWNCPYSTACFPQYAELIPQSRDQIDAIISPSISMLCDQAKAHGIWLVGGSVPEKSTETSGNELIYNTCVVINPDGDIVAKHRKVHLFDIDVPGMCRLIACTYFF